MLRGLFGRLRSRGEKPAGGPVAPSAPAPPAPAPSAPAPPAPAPPVSPAAPDVPVAPPGWTTLPPLRTLTEPPPATVDPVGFARTLTTRAVTRPALRAPEHIVTSEIGGVAGGLTTVVARQAATAAPTTVDVARTPSRGGWRARLGGRRRGEPPPSGGPDPAAQGRSGVIQRPPAPDGAGQPGTPPGPDRESGWDRAEPDSRFRRAEPAGAPSTPHPAEARGPVRAAGADPVRRSVPVVQRSAEPTGALRPPVTAVLAPTTSAGTTAGAVTSSAPVVSAAPGEPTVPGEQAVPAVRRLPSGSSGPVVSGPPAPSAALPARAGPAGAPVAAPDPDGSTTPDGPPSTGLGSAGVASDVRGSVDRSGAALNDPLPAVAHTGPAHEHGVGAPGRPAMTAPTVRPLGLGRPVSGGRPGAGPTGGLSKASRVQRSHLAGQVDQRPSASPDRRPSHTGETDTEVDRVDEAPVPAAPTGPSPVVAGGPPVERSSAVASGPVASGPAVTRGSAIASGSAAVSGTAGARSPAAAGDPAVACGPAGANRPTPMGTRTAPTSAVASGPVVASSARATTTSTQSARQPVAVSVLGRRPIAAQRAAAISSIPAARPGPALLPEDPLWTDLSDTPRLPDSVDPGRVAVAVGLADYAPDGSVVFARPPSPPTGLSIQRQPAPSQPPPSHTVDPPASEPVTPGAAPASAAMEPVNTTSTVDLADVADELYERIERRLRTDLLLERTRRGALADR
jgi:hypothetical protein